MTPTLFILSQPYLEVIRLFKMIEVDSINLLLQLIVSSTFTTMITMTTMMSSATATIWIDNIIVQVGVGGHITNMIMMTHPLQSTTPTPPP